VTEAVVESGAVYDRGYRPYDGPRGGRRAARTALYRASLRRALGLRRSWRQKVAPFVLLGIAVIPAIVNVGVTYLTRDTPADGVRFFTYREYVGVSNSLLVFVALAAPDLLCPDRRQRVLPLYFARPLTGADYVLAKLGAMFTLLFSFGFLPQVVLFIGQMLVSDDGSLAYAGDHLDLLWRIPVSVALLALFFSVVGLALASLSARRITAGAIIVGLFLVSSIVSSVIVGDDTVEGGSTAVRTPDGNTLVVQDPVIVEQEGSWAALIDLWGLPLELRDLVFFGHVDPRGQLAGVDGAGAGAVAVYVVVLLAAGATLFARYSEVER
jgi:ABC-2 type transport system permease protein